MNGSASSPAIKAQRATSETSFARPACKAVRGSKGGKQVTPKSKRARCSLRKPLGARAWGGRGSINTVGGKQEQQGLENLSNELDRRAFRRRTETNSKKACQPLSREVLLTQFNQNKMWAKISGDSWKSQCLRRYVHRLRRGGATTDYADYTDKTLG